MKKISFILSILLMILSGCAKKNGIISIVEDNQSIIEINFTQWNDSEKKEIEASTLSLDFKQIKGTLGIGITTSSKEKYYYRGTITEDGNFDVVINDLCLVTLTGNNFSGNVIIEQK